MSVSMHTRSESDPHAERTCQQHGFDDGWGTKPKLGMECGATDHDEIGHYY